MGVHSTYNQQTADTICERMIEGESLSAICRDKTMPSKSTVMRWLDADEHDNFRDRYTRACEARGDLYADQIIEIADNCADPAKARLQVDARKWVASKLTPKKYGDKIQNEITGADGGSIKTEDVTPMDLARRIAFALAAGTKQD